MSTEPVAALLGRGAGMRAMFAISFSSMINLCGVLERTWAL